MTPQAEMQRPERERERKGRSKYRQSFYFFQEKKKKKEEKLERDKVGLSLGIMMRGTRGVEKLERGEGCFVGF